MATGNGNGGSKIRTWLTVVGVAIGIVGGVWGLFAIVRGADFKAIDSQFAVHHDTLVLHAKELERARIEREVARIEREALKADQKQIKETQRQSLQLQMLTLEELGVSKLAIKRAMMIPDTADTN